MDADARRRLMTEAVQARAKAEALLQDLIAACAECDAQLTQQNRVDPIRQVTGKSSLDRAVHETRRIIETIDRALETADRAEPGLLRSLMGALAALGQVPRSIVA